MATGSPNASGRTRGAIALASVAFMPTNMSNAAMHSGHFGTSSAASAAHRPEAEEPCVSQRARRSGDFAVLITVLQPIHAVRERGFVASLGHQIQVVIGRVQHVDAA